LLIKELHEYDEQSKIYYDQVYKKNISWSLASAKAVQKMDSQSTLTELKKIWEIQ
jgi:predicted RNA-binding protein with PUA-like domain